MSIDDPEDLEIIIWHKPHHHVYGSVKSIWVSKEEDEVLALVKEQSDLVRPVGSTFEIIEEQEFEEKWMKNYPINEIFDLTGKIRYSPFRSYEFNKFGGTFFGVKIEYGFEKVTFEWHGSVETFDENVVNLYKYVFDI